MVGDPSKLVAAVFIRCLLSVLTVGWICLQDLMVAKGNRWWREGTLRNENQNSSFLFILLQLELLLHLHGLTL